MRHLDQLQITHLTNQKDQDRLLLLKEVAGTKVYEERRTESMKIMEETGASQRVLLIPVSTSLFTDLDTLLRM